MPDCESRTQRKYSIDMASDSTRFPNLCLKLIALAVAHREARGVQEIHLQMQKGLDQVGDRVHRVAVIAVQGNDHVSPGLAEPALVAPSIAAHFLPDHPAPNDDATSAVRSVELLSTTMVSSTNSGMRLQHSLDPLLLIQAGNNHRDRLPLIHESAPDRPARDGASRTPRYDRGS